MSALAQDRYSTFSKMYVVVVIVFVVTVFVVIVFVAVFVFVIVFVVVVIVVDKKHFPHIGGRWTDPLTQTTVI